MSVDWTGSLEDGPGGATPARAPEARTEIRMSRDQLAGILERISAAFPAVRIETERDAETWYKSLCDVDGDKAEAAAMRWIRDRSDPPTPFGIRAYAGAAYRTCSEPIPAPARPIGDLELRAFRRQVETWAAEAPGAAGPCAAIPCEYAGRCPRLMQELRMCLASISCPWLPHWKEVEPVPLQAPTREPGADEGVEDEAPAAAVVPEEAPAPPAPAQDPEAEAF